MVTPLAKLCNTAPKSDLPAGMWYQLALFFTEQEMGLAYTLIATASSLSGVAGGPLAAQLLQMDGFLQLRGWRVGLLTDHAKDCLS